MKLDAALVFYPPLALLLISIVILVIRDPVPGYICAVTAIAWLGITAWTWKAPALNSIEQRPRSGDELIDLD